MTKLSKTITLLLIITLANLFNVAPALALIPPLPSSFYGTVKVNGENITDGTTVKALINGQVYATGYTQTYEGNSVYSLDVPGDDSSTTTIEGGRDNDTIQFMIGEAPASETGIWKSATNGNVNLTATVAAPLNTPQATPTPVPTQTPIKPPKKAPTATTYVEPQPTEPVSFPTLTSEPAPTRTHTSSQLLSQPTQSIGQSPNDPTEPVQLSPIPAQSSRSKENGSGTNIFIAVFVLLLAVIVIWALRFFRKSSRSNER